MYLLACLVISIITGTWGLCSCVPFLSQVMLVIASRAISTPIVSCVCCCCCCCCFFGGGLLFVFVFFPLWVFDHILIDRLWDFQNIVRPVGYKPRMSFRTPASALVIEMSVADSEGEKDYARRVLVCIKLTTPWNWTVIQCGIAVRR